MAKLCGTVLCGALLSFGLSTGFASNSGWSLDAPTLQSVSKTEIAANSDFFKRVLMPFVDAILPNSGMTLSNLTKEQMLQAKTWGLTNQEELRYLKLMKGKDGVYYGHSGLTPVNILGINARSNRERQYYAHLASLQLAQRTAKEESFYSAYGVAYAHLMQQLKLPAVRPFNVKPFAPLNKTRVNLKAGDQALLFIDGNQAVSPMVTQALFAVMQTPNTHLNIYFEGPHDTKNTVENWANHQSIPKRLVQTGVITLNLRGGHWSSLSHHYSLPALFIVRDGKTIALTVRSDHA